MAEQPYKLISFDLDNTLYDNRPVIKTAELKNKEYLQQEFKAQHKEFDFDRFLDIRNRLMESKSQQQNEFAIALEDLTYLRKQVLQEFCECLQNADAIVEKALNLFLVYRSRVEVPDEITKMLATLSTHYTLVSITNGNCDADKTPMAGFFKRNYAPHLGFRAKPHRHMLEEALSDFKLAPHQLLHIGDQIDTDAKAAENADCAFYYFSPFEAGLSVDQCCQQLLAHLNLK